MREPGKNHNNRGDILHELRSYYIDKHPSCWILHHDDYDHGIASGKTKRECLRHLARLLLERDQEILADAYQEKMREAGEDYSFNDSLDALIHEASHNSKLFIEVLRPDLRQRFEKSGKATFIVEILE